MITKYHLAYLMGYLRGTGEYDGFSDNELAKIAIEMHTAGRLPTNYNPPPSDLYQNWTPEFPFEKAPESCQVPEDKDDFPF